MSCWSGVTQQAQELGVLAKPLIKVQLRRGARELNRLALIDTGADTSAVPRWMVSDGFGIDVSTLPSAGKTHGIGGNVPRFTLDAELRWMNHVIVSPVTVFDTGDTEEARRYSNFILLGREDFLRQYAVTFHWGSNPPTFDMMRYSWL